MQQKLHHTSKSLQTMFKGIKSKEREEVKRSDIYPVFYLLLHSTVQLMGNDRELRKKIRSASSLTTGEPVLLVHQPE